MSIFAKHEITITTLYMESERFGRYKVIIISKKKKNIKFPTNYQSI